MRGNTISARPWVGREDGETAPISGAVGALLPACPPPLTATSPRRRRSLPAARPDVGSPRAMSGLVTASHPHPCGQLPTGHVRGAELELLQPGQAGQTKEVGDRVAPACGVTGASVVVAEPRRGAEHRQQRVDRRGHQIRAPRRARRTGPRIGAPRDRAGEALGGGLQDWLCRSAACAMGRSSPGTDRVRRGAWPAELRADRESQWPLAWPGSLSLRHRSASIRRSKIARSTTLELSALALVAQCQSVYDHHSRQSS